MTTLRGAVRTYCRGRSCSAARARRQRRIQLSARSDPELREDPVQVRADRAVREEQAAGRSRGSTAPRRELGDLQLLRGQLIARLGHAAPAALAGCTQLAPRLLAPRCASERIEGVARSPQDARGTRRHVADVGATGRTRAESWRAGTATGSGRSPAPPRSDRLRPPGPRAVPGHDGARARSMCPGDRRRSPRPAPPVRARRRAGRCARAASARSAISQDEITGWYAESPGSNSRSA